MSNWDFEEATNRLVLNYRVTSVGLVDQVIPFLSQSELLANVEDYYQAELTGFSPLNGLYYLANRKSAEYDGVEKDVGVRYESTTIELLSSKDNFRRLLSVDDDERINYCNDVRLCFYSFQDDLVYDFLV